MSTLSYSARIPLCENPVTKQLLQIMEEKKTNLCVSADLTSASELLKLADTLGPYMCLLKTHVDIINDFSSAFVDEISALAAKHNFMIFEDRKFADIGNTVMHQYRDGVYHIASWAHITNAHIVPGPGIIDGLKEVGKPLGRGLLLLAEMSSKGSMATGAYTTKCVELANQHKDFVMGFIAQHCLTPSDPTLLVMTPGVQMAAGGDDKGQQYNTPESVVCGCGSDVIIVGRGIYGSKDPVAAAQAYQKAGWDAYLKRISQ
eukprot:comp21949_c0_seq1/m.31636 comp21949_c0_seq1/g.31636  ORF comp21949_c0_seq1/g.31636 comp21949_c0_seq1/m.31636 type:complete len:260 (-) comp21949_c0_seq1:398-1177(-)